MCRKTGSILIREAKKEDAQRLFVLNEEFNEPAVNTVAYIEQSLENNKHEIVCVTEVNGVVAGFCCVYITVSMCYANHSAEITELYVEEQHRRKGLAAGMIRLAEKLCSERYGVTEFKLLTGSDNYTAHEFYKSAGYLLDDEVVFVKE